jgi:quercetin dioxygenase-like cupin family protein
MKTNTSETARLTRLFLSMMVLLAALTARAAEDAVKIDNDQVRVLVVSSAADAKSPRHEHKMNRVMIYLDPGKMTLTEASGHVQTLNFKAGEVLWSPAAGMHVSQNISGHAVRIVEIELKSRPESAKAPVKTGPLDWVKVDPRRYKVELENDQVRVVRARWKAGDQGPLHEHPFNYVVAFLTDAKLQVTNAAGESGRATERAGEVAWGTMSKHREENVNDQPLELVVVELK